MKLRYYGLTKAEARKIAHRHMALACGEDHHSQLCEAMLAAIREALLLAQRRAQARRRRRRR